MTDQDIFTTELEGKERAGARLIDVREGQEYTQGHIPGALNLPLSELVGREDETGLMNLSGGTAAWRREGREVTRGEQP